MSSPSDSPKVVESADPTHHALSRNASSDNDDTLVEKRFGMKNEFVREFGSLSTFSFAFSIMGMTSSIATTFNTPLLYGGGPASVVWCWFSGSILNLSLGASIAEIVSAYPTCGGVYSASAWLVPKKHRAMTGWVVGWLNMLGQVAGVASTEWGLSSMIFSAVAIGRPGFTYTNAQQFGLYCGLLLFHGSLNSLKTRDLAFFTKFFVFINVGFAFLIIILLLALTPRHEMNSAAFIFTETINDTGYGNNGLAFLFGLLSVQWTMTDYDAVAHISFEVRRAAYAAPVAIFIAVLGTGIIGWLLNIVLVTCMPDISTLPGSGNLAFLEIMRVRIGLVGTLVVWPFVCLVAFFTVQTALQANSRTLWAFSRDHALPDRGLFGKLNRHTQTPIYAVWAVVIFSIALGCLSFASPIAIQAIFSMTAVALDMSYVIPVVCRLIYQNHPEVNFVPGPFYMGKWLGPAVNMIMVAWTFFECIILSFPTYSPLDAQNFNYSWVITLGVMVLSFLWFFASANKRYVGPLTDTQRAEDAGDFGGPVHGHGVPVEADMGSKPSSVDDDKAN